jgi:phenylalanine-4-hydroxylase
MFKTIYSRINPTSEAFMKQLPAHLQKYVVEQNYEKYTSQDQACWRYIMRQLKAFLGQHAHECYLEGLEKTGIEVDRIPRIEEISRSLEKFGWRALPVSGFIPPAAFMELQSLGVLPIASDMRTLEHLSYTPAPDIVHEAAGHAPILINKDFADYLKKYAQVAKNAIISKEDLELYDAIRELSDVKENPKSTSGDISAAQAKLEKVSRSMTHVSEATELGRMNWWTAEYGLIGNPDSPKIFGAGLLSSVGEAKHCLDPQVKKFQLTVDCIQQSYDITEPQPQLFVTPDFQTLSQVLEEMADKMAFRTGGRSGVAKAIEAQTVNTVKFDSGIQISGLFSELILDAEGLPAYLRTTGPSQLSFEGVELEGHSKSYHAQGYGTPVGSLKNEMATLDLPLGSSLRLQFTSGVTVEGLLKGRLVKNSKPVLLTFEGCTVKFKDRILFEPSWGLFDLALGTQITSVSGGPADREAYGVLEDFPARKVPAPTWSDDQLELYSIFSQIRKAREAKDSSRLTEIAEKLELKFSMEWLPRLEILEILNFLQSNDGLASSLKKQLDRIAMAQPSAREVISDGLKLSTHL